MTTLVLEFKKKHKMRIKHCIASFNWTQKHKRYVNESDIDDVFESIYTTATSYMQKSLEQDSGWIIQS